MMTTRPGWLSQCQPCCWSGAGAALKGFLEGAAVRGSVPEAAGKGVAPREVLAGREEWEGLGIWRDQAFELCGPGVASPPCQRLRAIWSLLIHRRC